MRPFGKLTKERRERRKKERYVFIKKYKAQFLLISKCKHYIPLDWRKHLHLPEIQFIIQEARRVLIYSDNTPDYTIWLTLYYNFYKTYLKPKIK
jgi:hypothetical protein